MNLKNRLKEWGLDSLKVNAGFLEADFSVKEGEQAGCLEIIR